MGQRTVVCAWCGNQFTAIRKDARFCKRNCHNHYQKGQMPEGRKCLWCGGPMDGKRRGALYCCRQHKKNAAAVRFRERNPGYYKQYKDCPRSLAWRAANRERFAAAAREARRNATPEQLAKLRDQSEQWRKANRAYYQVRERNRKAMKINNPDSVGVSLSDWTRLCRRYNNCCAYCGQKQDGMPQMDHVIPLIKGGRHAIGNVLPACRSCNISKNARYLISWRFYCKKPVSWPTAA
ncbi:HNH endonuclease [Mycobacterium sp. E1747]|uniref:HNH endonuclease n=1 Tax=Mycobacterium sp. E1747 TaxID=1834128 RepID=UPI0009EF6470|nr:HNH endonuclease signature motif containing protein [Mycobacterium sp. E1747]